MGGRIREGDEPSPYKKSMRGLKWGKQGESRSHRDCSPSCGRRNRSIASLRRAGRLIGVAAHAAHGVAL